MAHYFGEADEFVDRFAFHAQRGEESGDLCVVGLARKDAFHSGFGFAAGEIFAGDDFFEGLMESEVRGSGGRWMRCAERSSAGLSARGENVADGAVRVHLAGGASPAPTTEKAKARDPDWIR